MYVNDIDEGLTCKISKFADYTKILDKVITTAEKIQFQSNLDFLVNYWSGKWQVKFNIDKCEILHIGNKHNHKIYNEWFRTFQGLHEKCLGVTISKHF